MRFLFFTVTLLAFVAVASAANVAVLETSADPSIQDSVSLSDRQFLTDVFREQAVMELPATENYTIMTRDNINAMLPPGKSIEECEGNCLAETGRNIAADYICQARVGSFSGNLTLSAELYETASNKLIASFTALGSDLSELLESVKKQAPNFFRSIKDGFAGFGNEPPVPEAASTATDSTGTASDTLSNITETNTEESIPSNVETGKKRGSHWVSIAVCTGVTLIGSVMTIIGNTLAKDAAERGGQTLSRLEDNRDDAETGQTLRGIGIGLALVGAVSLTLSLSF